MWCSGAKITVQGKENIPTDQPVLFVANHKSYFDIPILVSIIDVPMAFIGKMELKKMPIVSYWMKRIHCIFMDRDDIRQSLKAINQGIEQIKEGQSLLIFPEGTRIKGDELGEFKKGSLKLATKSNAPIVPVYIGNAYKILEAHFPWVKATDITVNIGAPIELDALSLEDKKNLSEYVKCKIEELREM
ncbi:MAG: 1-acyl-sn-glycerol-3-phosphate acyltransferase [Epulopiscium sp.]|nr:1-acyl-sn-glycerol-3-phosphate acyltransferase [Candidatus Epulonipiscium sp.]